MGAQGGKVRQFHRLHESGCFVMPNPWDVGSARALAGMGFPALASTSAGFAWTIGRADTQAGLEEVLDHLGRISAAVDVPVNADLEAGYAVEPDAVARHVSLAVRTGIAGLSIEDSSRDGGEPLLEVDLAVDRIVAARQAIDESGTGVLLTARSEGFVVGRPDLAETVRRLQRFADAGADCLYAPRISTVEEIRTIVESVAPKPVNLLVNAPFITVEEAAALGVRRSASAAPWPGRPGEAGCARRTRSPSRAPSGPSPSCRTWRGCTGPTATTGRPA